MIGIYCIQNLLDGKRYIGQSKNIGRRLNDHRGSLRRGCHRNIHLQRAWNLYGEINFEFSAVLYCEIESLDTMERLYINMYSTMNDKYGYNLEGGGNRNKVMSEETRKKISESRTGRSFFSESTLKKIAARMKGNKYRLGMPMPEKSRAKLAESHKGNKYTLGLKHTDEAKRKMSEKRKGKDNHRTGTIQSEEARKKISESLKKAKRFFNPFRSEESNKKRSETMRLVWERRKNNKESL